MKKSLIYLGSPYSDPDPAVMEARFQAVCKAAAQLMSSGLHIFSPIAHTHPILRAGHLPTRWSYWEKFDRAVLETCRTLTVLKLDGWERSTGLAGEIKIAHQLVLPTFYVSPNPHNLDTFAQVMLTLQAK